MNVIESNDPMNQSLYKSNKEYKLQKQLDISEEVLKSLENNKSINNSKLYQYLNNFDSLLFPEEDKKLNHE